MRILKYIGIAAFYALIFSVGGFSAQPIVETLPNGLTYAIWPQPDSQVVSVRVLVRAGSIHEVGKDAGSGLAHYLEHLVAGGSTRLRSEAEYRLGIAKMGGASNAFTTFDHTGYFINTTPDDAGMAIQYLSEWMFESRFTQSEFVRERDVITKEMEKSESNLGRVFFDCSNRFFYPDHPAGRPIIGYRANFNVVTPDQIRAFYRTHYVPNNMVVVVVGNVDARIIARQIKNAFGKYPTQAVAELPNYKAAVPFTSRSQTVIATTNVAYVSVRFPTVDLLSTDLYALDLLDNILGDGDRSILKQKLVYDQQLASSIDTISYTPLFTDGYFEITAVCQPDHVSEVQSEIKKALDSVKSQLIEPARLLAAQRQKSMEYYTSFDDSNEMSARLADSLLYSRTPDFFKLYTQRMSMVSPADLQRVANRYFDFDRMVSTVLLGQGAKQESMSQQPTTTLIQPEIVKLDNGVRVVLMPPDEWPRINVRAFVLGGLRAESWDTNGMGYLLRLLWGKGSTQFDRQSLAEAFESRGATLDTQFGMRSISLEMTAFSSDISILLPRFSDAFWQPKFDSNTFSVAQGQQQTEISERESDWFKYVMTTVRAGFYRGYAFSFPMEGSAEKVARLTPDLIQQWHSALVDPENVVVVVSGGYERVQTLKLLGDFFGKQQKQSSVLSPFRSLAFTPLTQSITVTGSIKQPVSVVVMAMKSPSYRDLKGTVVADTLDSVLSGMEFPGGRLQTLLRGQADGLVYMVHAQTIVSPETGLFFIYALTSSDKMAQVRQTIQEQLDQLMNFPISEAELKAAVDQQRFSYRSQLNDARSRDQSIGIGVLQQLPVSYWTDRIQMADSVTTADVQSMAKTVFKTRYTYLFNDKKETLNGLKPKPVPELVSTASRTTQPLLPALNKVQEKRPTSQVSSKR